MARILGIDWEHQYLRVIDATIQRGKLTIHQARAWAEPIDPNPAEAEDAGRRLAERLKEAGIAPAPVLFSVARSRLIFREVVYPDVPAEEIPAIVQFQAAKELSFPANEATVDYALCSVPGPSGAKRALAVVMHNDLLAAIKKTVQIAGLRLLAVTGRPFGVWSSLRVGTTGPKNATDEPTAVLTVDDGAGELCVGRNNELLFSRPMTATNRNGHEDLSSTYLPELRRTLAAYASQVPRYPVRTLYVSGGNIATGNEVLAAGVRMPIVAFDPFAGNGQVALDASRRGMFSGLVGLLELQATQATLPINFLAPKQVKPPPSRKKYYLAGAAAAAVLVAAVGGWYWLESSSRDTAIEEWQSKKSVSAKQIANFGDVEKKLEAINSWSGQEMIVLDEMYDFIAAFPDQPNLRITKINWSPIPQSVAVTAPQNKTIKGPISQASKPIGQFVFEATGDSSDTLDKLRRAIDSRKQWKIDGWDKDTPGTSQVRATVKVFHVEPQERTNVLGPTANRTVGLPAPSRPAEGGQP